VFLGLASSLNLLFLRKVNPLDAKKSSALTEKQGVSPSEITSSTAIHHIQTQRKKQPSAEMLIEGIFNGDQVALSRAITLIESTNPAHNEKAAIIIEKCLPRANKSVRIGITGVPGVGKSTFIEAFGSFITGLGNKIAVLAVDPSSSVSKGSILGDKTRMEELVKDQNAFIRPSPSGTSLGGVARKTREAIILCEACGFDTIIVETVGVGQSETAVHGMVDFFLLLKLAGAGDELQGIKRGIMEMADAIVINKADGDNVTRAIQAKTDFTRALHLYPPKDNGWVPKVLTASAIQNEGVQDVWELIQDYTTLMKKAEWFDKKRTLQNKYWLLQNLDDRIKSAFYDRQDMKKALEQELIAIENHQTTPFAAAQKLFDLYNK